MDATTILNPPYKDWLQEWDSLQYRLFRIFASQTDELLQQVGSELTSFVVEELQKRIADNQGAPALVEQLKNEMTVVVGWQQQIPTFSQAQLGHLNTMLEQLATYSQHLAEIFGENFEHKLTDSRRYSPSHVNRTLLRQITTDLRITELALTQRLPLNGEIQWDTHLLYLSDLMAYDALQPLKDAGIVPKGTAIITYMQRQTDIRMTPYYHAVLLGFPSAAPNKSVSPPHEFLTIPHEIGHYFYRYGTLDRIPRDAREPGVIITRMADALGWSEQRKEELMHDAWLIMSLQEILEELLDRTKTTIVTTVRKICDVMRASLARHLGDSTPIIDINIEVEDVRRVLTPRVHEALAKKLVQQNVLPTDWRSHWLEELFCDAYGCLIAGPVNVLGFQTLLSDEQYENDHLQRGKHPIAALRPLIQSEMLREMHRRGAANYALAPDRLDAHWQHHLQQYGDPDYQHDILEATFTPEGQTPALTGRQMVDALQIIIDQIFDLFAEIFGPNVAPVMPESGEKRLTVPWTPWTSDMTKSTDAQGRTLESWEMMQQLAKQFEQYYTRDGAPTATHYQQDIGDDSTETAAMQHVRELATGVDSYSSDHRMPVSEWFEVFAVDGWSTEGPRGSGVNP